MYLTFDLLEPATELAIEYIDAVSGHGKEFFGLKVYTCSESHDNHMTLYNCA